MRGQTKPLDRLLVRLKLKQPGGSLTREQILHIWPVRNPALKTYFSEDGLVTFELPRRKDWMGKLLGFLFSVPEAKPVQLDEVGTFVWNLCDGDHTVGDIVAALTVEYKLNRREAEVSLTQYLQQLAKRGIIAFAIPREIAEAAGLQGALYSPETAPPSDEAALPPEANETETQDVERAHAVALDTPPSASMEDSAREAKAVEEAVAELEAATPICEATETQKAAEDTQNLPPTFSEAPSNNQAATNNKLPAEADDA